MVAVCAKVSQSRYIACESLSSFENEATAKGAATRRVDLNRCVDGLLEVSRFRDYCPNALQVEGRVVNSAARALRRSSICSPGNCGRMRMTYLATTSNSPCAWGIAIFFCNFSMLS